MFYDNFAWACTEIKISSFKTRKWPTLSGFLFFFHFFPPFLFSFQWFTFYCTCFQFKIFWESHWNRKILPWSSYVQSRAILLQAFQSHFWAFCAYSISGSTEQITLIWVSLEWANEVTWRKLKTCKLQKYRNFFFGEGGGGRTSRYNVREWYISRPIKRPKWIVTWWPLKRV